MFMVNDPVPTRAGAARRIIFVVACVLIAEWIFPRIFGRSPWAFSVMVLCILAFGFLTHRAFKEKPRDLGLRMDNFARALLLLSVPILLSLFVLAALGYKWGSLCIPISPGWRHIRNYGWLIWWALLQQYALQAIINRQAQIVWGQGFRSIAVVGLIFSMLHIPNAVLMVATLAGGMIWAYVYQRAPNLFALALSHSIMTVALVWALPPSLLHSLRVGAGYY
jgi:membrane protease YdiL (CAAX protease family)